jgi:hypothetical protein
MPWGWDKVSYQQQAAGAHECLGGFFVLGVRSRVWVCRKLGEPNWPATRSGERMIQDERLRLELSKLLDETEEQLRRNPNSLPRMKPADFGE